jgi:curved DNA-binding protein CbpA
MDASFLEELERRVAELEGLDYFEVLRLPRTAGPGEVKAAYYRESRAFHPDRFAAASSGQVREQVARIYRRVNEAYTVLRDDARRSKYLADVSGPDRARKLRFTEADESQVKQEQKQKLDDQLGQTPNGRKFYAAALTELQARRWDGAERAIKSALMYEPQNPKFKELLAQVERSKPKSDPFKIK